jgi:acyl carrier protein phosphodiesterase
MIAQCGCRKMNWLAHLVLSESSPAFRVGNVLADILPITELRQLAPPFQPGIARHRAIDSFTDKHPTFKRSVSRLDPRFRRYGAVVMDIFYDHLLTASWNEHVDTRLDEFVEAFHNDVEKCRDDIPANAYAILRHMRAGEWLTSYGDADGVRLTLNRMSRRLRRPFDLGSAADELPRHYDDLTHDFAEFFPQIRRQFD